MSCLCYWFGRLSDYACTVHNVADQSLGLQSKKLDKLSIFENSPGQNVSKEIRTYGNPIPVR